MGSSVGYVGFSFGFQVLDFDLAGKIYDLNSPQDFPGTYGAAQSTFAVAGGATNMTMKNQNGVTVVILKNSGKESGTH